MTDQDSIQKQWSEASFNNNFVFSKTLELFPDICKQIIELILNIKVNRISYPEREKVIEARTDSKGIRLDVYVQDDFNRSFDLEMQIANSDNISKRMRYYQGLIDGDKLKQGQHYSSLTDSYIIFICPFDRFNRGCHIYTFRERCDEDTSLTLDDGSVKIFLSTKGTIDDVSPELKNFLNYVDSGIVAGNFIQKLDNAVNSVKSNEKARLDFMTFQMYIKEHEEKVREEERTSIALNMIRAGLPFDQVQQFTKLTLDKIADLAKKLNQSND